MTLETTFIYRIKEPQNQPLIHLCVHPENVLNLNYHKSALGCFNHFLIVGSGNTIDQVKNGASAPFLQIRDGLGANRGLKGRPKKKKKGETRQCQTGRKNTRV